MPEKSKSELNQQTRASVAKEMAKPRMSKSVRTKFASIAVKTKKASAR